MHPQKFVQQMLFRKAMSRGRWKPRWDELNHEQCRAYKVSLTRSELFQKECRVVRANPYSKSSMVQTSHKPKRESPYLGAFSDAQLTGLEPATSRVTGGCSNQLSYNCIPLHIANLRILNVAREGDLETVTVFCLYRKSASGTGGLRQPPLDQAASTRDLRPKPNQTYGCIHTRSRHRLLT